MAVKFRNVWGAANSNLDQQRGDLFRVALNLPVALGGVGKWNDVVQFAITKFPFPAREREMIPTKYLNQTNFQLGADTASGTIAMTIRYAFNQDTAVILEQWHWMHAHPGTGGVALTSKIKTNGYFYWLIPNMDGTTPPVGINAADPNPPLADGGAYALEGVMLKGLKPSDPDMEASNNLVNLEAVLQIDRYYPINPTDLRVGTPGQDAAAGIVASNIFGGGAG